MLMNLMLSQCLVQSLCDSEDSGSEQHPQAELSIVKFNRPQCFHH